MANKSTFMGWGLSIVGLFALAGIPLADIVSSPQEQPKRYNSGNSPWSVGYQEPEHSASSHPLYFRNCAEARAAGVAPISIGEPGYRSNLDGDSDGIACKPYRGR